MAGNHLEAEAGIADSTKAGYRYLIRLGLGLADEQMARRYSTLAPRALTYFEELVGVRWRLVRDLADYYYPEFDDARAEGRYVEVEPLAGATLGSSRARLRTSPHVPFRLTSDDISRLGGSAASHRWDPALLARREQEDLLASGTGLAAYFISALDEIDVWTDAVVQRLDLTGDRVAGLWVRVDGEVRSLRARCGVLLATGGYDWNPGLATAFEGHADIHSSAPPAITGDHLALALPAGAAVTQVPKPTRLGYPVPDAYDDGQPQWRMLAAGAFPHAMLVNRDGRRFGDESFYPSIGNALKVIDGARQRFPNWPCWVIVDAQFRERYTFGAVRPGDAFPEEWGVLTANSIGELAQAAGINVAGLENEVRRFNRFCEEGIDHDFARGERPWSQRWYGDTQRRGNANLGTVGEPPFHAYRPGLLGVGIPTLGLVANGDGQVVGHRGQPIEGLYAVGNSVAIVEAGAGYQSGVANTRSLAFAWAAARHAAGQPIPDGELALA